MRKNYILLIVAVLLLNSLFYPGPAGNAYSVLKGNIISGQTYFGKLVTGSDGSATADEYTLNIPENSMIRLFAYNKDNIYTLQVGTEENPDSTVADADKFTSIRGSDSTVINESRYRQGVFLSGTTNLEITANVDNPSEYAEMFTNIMKGSYILRVKGKGSYNFKVLIVPLKYSDDSPMLINDRTAAATPINTDEYYEGNMLSNVKVNGKWISNQFDFYTFEAREAGKYTLSFATDGFLQASAGFLDSYSAAVPDATMDVALNFGNAVKLAGTFEQHVSAAKIFTREFNLSKPGKYYFTVTRYGLTSGSYQFKIISPNPLPQRSPTPVPTPKITNVPKTLKIVPDSLTLLQSHAKALRAVVTYTNGSSIVVTGKVIWTSSKSTVARVDEKGNVRAVGAGEAYITGKFSNITGKAHIIVKSPEGKSPLTTTVKPGPTSTVKPLPTPTPKPQTKVTVKKIIPAKTVIYLKKGQTGSNKITAEYSNGAKKDVTSLVKLSTSGKAVTINKNNTIKAVSNGSVTITAALGNVKTSYKVIIR